MRLSTALCVGLLTTLAAIAQPGPGGGGPGPIIPNIGNTNQVDAEGPGYLKIDRIADGHLVNAFGDSITVGVGATTTNTGYIADLARAEGWTFNNWAKNSSQVWDQAPWVMGFNNFTIATNSVSTLALGINDAAVNQSSNTISEGLTLFSQAHQAEIAFLAIPDGTTNKLFGNSASITRVGQWDTLSHFGTNVIRSWTVGSTATFSVFGNHVLVCYGKQYWPAAAGTFSLTIDGTSYGSYNSFTTGNLTTINGMTNGPGFIVIPNLGVNTHTCVVTVTSPTSNLTNFVYIWWVAGIDQLPNQRVSPHVYVSNASRKSTTGYANTGGSDTNLFNFNRVIAQDVVSLASLGLDVTLVNIVNAFDPFNQSTDGIHPNDAGHAQIAEAWLWSINRLAKPGLRTTSEFVSNPDHVYAIKDIAPGTTTMSNLPLTPPIGDRIWAGDVITPRGTGWNVVWDGTIWRLDGWTQPAATSDPVAYFLNAFAESLSVVNAKTMAFSWNRPVLKYASSTGLGQEVNTGASSGSVGNVSGGYPVIGLTTGSTAAGDNIGQGTFYTLLSGDRFGAGWVSITPTAATSAETFYAILNSFSSSSTLTNIQAESSGFVYDPFNGTGITNSLPAADYGLTNYWIAYSCHSGTTNCHAAVANSLGLQRFFVTGTTTSNIFYVNGSAVLTNTVVPTVGGYYAMEQITKIGTGATSRILYTANKHSHLRYATALTLP